MGTLTLQLITNYCSSHDFLDFLLALEKFMWFHATALCSVNLQSDFQHNVEVVGAHLRLLPL